MDAPPRTRRQCVRLFLFTVFVLAAVITATYCLYLTTTEIAALSFAPLLLLFLLASVLGVLGVIATPNDVDVALLARMLFGFANWAGATWWRTLLVVAASTAVIWSSPLLGPRAVMSLAVDCSSKANIRWRSAPLAAERLDVCTPPNPVVVKAWAPMSTKARVAAGITCEAADKKEAPKLNGEACRCPDHTPPHLAGRTIAADPPGQGLAARVVVQGCAAGKTYSFATSSDGTFEVGVDRDDCVVCKRWAITAAPVDARYHPGQIDVTCDTLTVTVTCPSAVASAPLDSADANRTRGVNRTARSQDVGWLRISAFPWARIRVAGRTASVTQSNLAPIALPTAEYSVDLCNEDYKPVTRKVRVTPGQTTDLVVRWALEPDRVTLLRPRPCE